MKGLLVFALMAAMAVSASETIKFKDSATSKVRKPPKGLPLPPFETAEKYGSQFSIVINAPGVSAAQFNGDSIIKVTFDPSSSSGDEEAFEFTFKQDTKYVAGTSSSVKIATQAGPAGVELPANFKELAILQTMQVKLGKDVIALNFNSKYLPVFAQQFLNFGSIPNGVGVKFPEGKSEHTRIVTVTVQVGTVTKTFTGAEYTVVTNNKKVKGTDPQLWQGTATGQINIK